VVQDSHHPWHAFIHERFPPPAQRHTQPQDRLELVPLYRSFEEGLLQLAEK
jgi:hypothetical protein